MYCTLSATGATSFYDHTVIVLLMCVILELAFYSKFVTTFPTGSAGHGSAGRSSTYRFNPLNAVISYFYA